MSNYITNNFGEIKVIAPGGKEKWFSRVLIEDSVLMREGGFIIATAPKLLDPIIEEQEVLTSQIEEQEKPKNKKSK